MSDVSRLPGPMDHAWQWQRLGSCRGMDSAVFFHPDGERNPSRARCTANAKEVCQRCPVMDMCREFALQTREPFGAWGGLAEAERRIILERRGTPIPSRTPPWGGQEAGEPSGECRRPGTQAHSRDR